MKEYLRGKEKKKERPTQDGVVDLHRPMSDDGHQKCGDEQRPPHLKPRVEERKEGRRLIKLTYAEKS